MRKIVVIGDSDMITGFRLAGIDGVYPEKELTGSLKGIMSDESVGIVLIGEKTAEKNREMILEINKRVKDGPIIVEIPDKTGPAVRETDPIKELIRRAVGVEIE